LLDGQVDSQQAGEQIARIDAAHSQLLAAITPLYHTAVQEFLSWICENDEYRAWYTSHYASNNDTATVSAVNDAIAQLRARQEDTVDAFATAIQDVREQYGFEVAHSFVEHTLSPPVISVAEVSIHTPDGPTPISQEAILRRADACRNALDKHQAPTRRSHAERRTSLREAVSDTAVDASTAVAPVASPETVLPLLDTGVDTEGPTPANSGDFLGAPTGLSWLIHRACDLGKFRAVVYWRDGCFQRLINPFLEDDSASHADFATDWERAFIADRVIDQMFAPLEGTAQGSTEIKCPLCALSSTMCGSDTCAFNTEIETLNHVAPDVRTGIETSDLFDVGAV
jgi:hypothetical protein